jgi:hypothetical protein
VGLRFRHPASSRVVQRRRTTGSSFYADVFKVHHHSAIPFGAPTFIPFVQALVLPSPVFINVRKKARKNGFNTARYLFLDDLIAI